eukprot:1151462-Pelagomonas_calceolata.AAC.1
MARLVELMDIMLAGEDQSQADQPNSLAEGPPVTVTRANQVFTPASMLLVGHVMCTPTDAIV